MIMTTGQRVMVTEFGNEPLDAIEQHLRVEQLVVPEDLGPNEVLVAVRSAAVSWVDLLMTSGQYQHAPQPPYCPGMEYSGVIASKGAQVQDLSVGDAVIADGLLTGPRSLGDYQRYGGFASHALAPADAVTPLPEGLSHDQGCHLLSSYATAYHSLIHRGDLTQGETVLIHGASGATGLAAVHLAKLLGATVIATGRSAAKLEVVAAQGADHSLVTCDEQGQPRRFRDEIKSLTGGAGVDVVYDAVGGDISLESLRCVRFGARFLIVGWSSTPFVARGKGKRGAPRANQLPTNLIMMKGLDVLGCPAAISAVHDPAMSAERRARILSWAADGKIVPHVAKSFPLSEVREAMLAKWHSRHVGAVVLKPAQ